MNRQIANLSKAQAGGPPALITQKNRPGLAPFVLFDAGAMDKNDWLSIDWHPHSGVATVTLPYDCHLHHADSAGNGGIIRDGGLQWMASGSGIWHKEQYEPVNKRIGIHQLWILLPPEEEKAPVNYFNLQSDDIPTRGNTRVLLGEYQGLASAVAISQDVNYFEVNLKANESWQFIPPESQTRGFVFPRDGSITVEGTEIDTEEFVQFDETNSAVSVSSHVGSTFVIGFAKPWGHPIVHEYGQMHTSQQALQVGKERIAELGSKLKEQSYA